MTVTYKELQKVEKKLFLEFIKICEENQLTWFVLGGTVLGAVRHKGFIPWDDDIDVAMPREDYERFLNIAQEELPSNMFLQTYKTDENYPHIFAKIRKSDTTFIETSVSLINMNHGVYLDVFPLDGYPKSKVSQKIFHLKEKILKIAISEVFKDEKGSGISVKKILKNTIAKTIPCRNAVKKLDSLYKKYSYNDSKKVANFGGAWGKKEIMAKEIFGNGIQGEFEGNKVILPEKTHEYLTLLYGDYMILPPLEKRISHHHCTIIDLENSYTKYKDSKN